MDNPWLRNSKEFPNSIIKDKSLPCEDVSLESVHFNQEVKQNSAIHRLSQENCKRYKARMSICALRDKFRSPRTKNIFILFCSTTSMKGMNKISRGPKPMRILWIFFVIIMSSVLIVSSCLLVRDFMLYEVNINTEVRLESQTPFPSITICHHHPFSNQAFKLWKEKKILSPTIFNRIMRNLTQKQLLENKVEDAQTILNYDVISVYYQNLLYEDSKRIGHQMDIFLSCNHLTNNHISFEDDCSKLEDYVIRNFSHHEHFNCYTFEARIKDISTLGIIASMGPYPDYNDTEQGFIIDTFKQAQGLKVHVHEPGIPPDIDNAGLHVEPGKMNEISYRPEEWELIDSPNKPCFHGDNKKTYKDLDLDFNYTQDLCIKSISQKEFMDKCNCIYIFNPRIKIPTKEVPYCGRFIDDLNMSKIVDRVKCIEKIYYSDELKEKTENAGCFQRCKYTKYETSISITKWRATEWHLHWIRSQLLTFRKLNQFLANSNGNVNVTMSPYYKSWYEYYMSKNLTKISDDKKETFLDNGNFAYIVLRRESLNSVRKYERLVITPYVLVSRIGGLCSLTVGITASFFVELLEFLYLYCKSKNEQKNDNSKNERPQRSQKKLLKNVSKDSRSSKNSKNSFYYPCQTSINFQKNTINDSPEEINDKPLH